MRIIWGLLLASTSVLAQNSDVIKYCVDNDYVTMDYKVISRSNGFNAVFGEGSPSKSSLDYVLKSLKKVPTKSTFDAYVKGGKLYMKSRSSGKFVVAKKSTAKTVCKSHASVALAPILLEEVNHIISQKEASEKAAAAHKAKLDAIVLAEKKAKAEADALEKEKAEAKEKEKAEARKKEIEAENARLAPIHTEISNLSKELRAIEMKIHGVSPKATFVIVKSKMDNGAIQAVVNGELAAIVDIDGVVTEPGPINLYLVKMKSLYTRKESGFEIPVTTYGINADPERELREYKVSPEGKADAERAEYIKLKVQKLKSQL